MNKRILTIGKVTKDNIIMNDNQYYQIGGAVYYHTLTLNRLNFNVESIISIGKDDVKMLNHINTKKTIIPTQETMEYTNIYDEKLRRKQKAKLTKEPILPKDININQENITNALISPLSPYDIPPETIKHLKTKNIQTILLPQGYLRKTDKNNNIIEKKWTNIKSYLKYTDILCLDEKEAKNAFNLPQIKDEKIEHILKKHNIKQIIITKAEKGSTIYTQTRKYKIPAIRTKNEVDATGLGDTYIAAYTAKLEECRNIPQSGLFASITAKEKLKHKGPLRTGRNKIEKELDKYRQ